MEFRLGERLRLTTEKGWHAFVQTRPDHERDVRRTGGRRRLKGQLGEQRAVDGRSPKIIPRFGIKPAGSFDCCSKSIERDVRHGEQAFRRNVFKLPDLFDAEFCNDAGRHGTGMLRSDDGAGGATDDDCLVKKTLGRRHP